jgi:hypothetical protein
VVDAPHRDDWLAEFLLHTPGLPLTVMSGGTLISGIAITTDEFFARVGELLGTAIERTGADSGPIRAFFASQEEGYRVILQQRTARRNDLYEAETREATPVSAEEAEAQLQEILPHFLHLKDVVVSSTPGSTFSLPLWRARLSEISGWTFGQIPVEINAVPSI